jgi:hypothetical protein
MTDYYASPTRRGSGSSEATPFLIADAWSVIQPGDTLYLLDGVYKGFDSMIQPLAGVTGTIDQRITIRALNDGKVLIDGEGQQNRVVWLTWGNDYFTIEGINAANGLNYVIDASGVGNIFRRTIAWNAIESTDGEQTWKSSGYNALVEDCAAFGGRYAMGCNQMGNDAPSQPMTTFRRCLAVFTEATITSPKASVVYWYNSDPCRWENCVTIWDCRDAPNSQGLFYCATADPYVHGALQTEVIGCIAYVKASHDAPAAISGFSAQGNRRITFDNCLAAMSPNNPAPYLIPFDLRAASITQFGSKDLYIKNSTALGANPSNIHPDWVQTNIKHGSSVAAVYGSESLFVNDGTKGATICKRYLDGILTAEGLWPLPINQRVIDAMIMAGHQPIDVMADLEQVFGPVPDVCRWDGGENGGGDIVTATFTAIPDSVAPGEDVEVSWTGGVSTRDWFGLYKIPEGNLFDKYHWAYTSSCASTVGPVAVSGSCTVTMPTELGTYEFRLFANDSEQLLATSNQVTVQEPEPEPEPPPDEGMLAWIIPVEDPAVLKRLMRKKKP